MAQQRENGRGVQRSGRKLFSNVVSAKVTADPLNPAHYQQTQEEFAGFKGPDGAPFQAYHVIQIFGLNFFIGNAVKYLLRQGKKVGEDSIKDLGKAGWYVAKEIVNQRHARGEDYGDIG